MTFDADKLYSLLPSVYRLRDAQAGGALRALVEILADQAQIVERDIEQLYDNWFIETCDEWVVPYIGDLIGARGLHQVSPQTFSQRAWVANTLGYRRRKGTATMLEQLARDVTGWPARAVEFFERLATSQHCNHVRLDAPATASLRNPNSLELTDTAFDALAHTGEVRSIAARRGRYNIPEHRALPLAAAELSSRSRGGNHGRFAPRLWNGAGGRRSRRRALHLLSVRLRWDALQRSTH